MPDPVLIRLTSLLASCPGLDRAECAARLGVSRQSVYNAAKQHKADTGQALAFGKPDTAPKSRSVGHRASAQEPERTADPSRWAVASWLSSALDDPKVCSAMKRDIRDWFRGGGDMRPAVPPDDLDDCFPV